jgi:hypothetical protein
MKNRVRQLPQVRIQPDSGAVMIEAIAARRRVPRRAAEILGCQPVVLG